MADVFYRASQNRVAWYLQGGLAEVLHRIPGNGSGSTAKLAGFIAVFAK